MSADEMLLKGVAIFTNYTFTESVYLCVVFSFLSFSCPVLIFPIIFLLFLYLPLLQFAFFIYFIYGIFVDDQSCFHWISFLRDESYIAESRTKNVSWFILAPRCSFSSG